METTVTYKCPNCDAGLVFDAAKGKFVCEFCMSEFTEEELRATDSAERAEQTAKANEEFAGEVNEYICQSCGAVIMTDKATAADYCYYCHNPVVLADRVTGAFRPDKIVPFKFDKTAAKESFLRFAKKKFFVPRDYFSPEQADKITGVYYPFWLTDADTHSEIDATATRVRVWRTGNTEYTETSTFRIHRAGKIHFEDISTSAISTEDKGMLEGVLPYPPEAQTDFSMPYLLGYQAKRRDIDRDALAGEVKSRMNTYAEKLLRGTIGSYATVTVTRTDVGIIKSHWDYSLMPVWILTYNRDGKLYTYSMNGNTGKVYGELPIAWGRLFAVLGGIFGALLLILSLIGGFLF